MGLGTEGALLCKVGSILWGGEVKEIFRSAKQDKPDEACANLSIACYGARRVLFFGRTLYLGDYAAYGGRSYTKNVPMLLLRLLFVALFPLVGWVQTNPPVMVVQGEVTDTHGKLDTYTVVHTDGTEQILYQPMPPSKLKVYRMLNDCELVFLTVDRLSYSVHTSCGRGSVGSERAEASTCGVVGLPIVLRLQRRCCGS